MKRLLFAILFAAALAQAQMTPAPCPSTAPSKATCWNVSSYQIYLFPLANMKFTCAAVKAGKPAQGVLCTAAAVPKAEQKQSWFRRLFSRKYKEM